MKPEGLSPCSWPLVPVLSQFNQIPTRPSCSTPLLLQCQLCPIQSLVLPLNLTSPPSIPWPTALSDLANTGIARAERDGKRAENRFRLSPKQTSPFKSVGASVQSTAGSRGVRISFSNAGETTFGGGVRVLATHSIRQFPLHFPSRASPCATRFRTSSTSYCRRARGQTTNTVGAAASSAGVCMCVCVYIYIYISVSLCRGRTVA